MLPVSAGLQDWNIEREFKMDSVQTKGDTDVMHAMKSYAGTLGLYVICCGHCPKHVQV